MATELTTSSFTMTAVWNYKNDLDINDPVDNFTWAVRNGLTDGTTTDKADLLFHDERTLVGTSESLDLAGSLVDPFGNTLTFVEIVGIGIQVVTRTAGYILKVGGAGANDFINWVANATDIVQVGAGGQFLLTAPVDGYAVTAGTGDLLKIDSGANTIVYRIVLIGRSA